MEVFEDLELIKLLFTFGFIFLMWMKSFWDELQEYKAEFYPDGLDKCPPETYTIDDDSGRVKCSSCPTCRPGEDPSPPCGSTLAIKASGECVPCKTGTFSDEADSAACKVCTDCATRNVVSSCTADKNTKCEECPWRHYEDPTTHSCRHCSSCCEKNSVAQMECLVSKTCKENCSQLARSKGRYFSSIFNRLVTNVLNSSYSTRSVSNRSRRPNVRQDFSKRLETAINNNTEEPSRSGRDKRGIRLSVKNLQDYIKDNTNGKTKNSMSDSSMDKDADGNEILDTRLAQISDISSNDREKNNFPIKNVLRIFDVNRNEKEIQLVSTKLQSHVPSPTAPDTNLGQFMIPTPGNPKGPKIVNGNGAMREEQLVSTKLQPSVHPPTERESNIGLFMPLKPEHPITSKDFNGNGALKKGKLFSSTLQTNLPSPPESNMKQLMPPSSVPVKTTTSTAATEQSRFINTEWFLSSFSGTIAAFLVLGFIALIAYIVYRRCVRNSARGYRVIRGSDIPGEAEQIEEDQLDENSNNDDMQSSTREITTEICDRNYTTRIEEDLNLSEIPLDLEDMLVIRLDVEHGKPESKEFGWQKVGRAAGISEHELKFYQTENLRQNGSPTKLLLEKLGSQGKTISDLLAVLQKPRVQLVSVAALIRQHLRRT